MSYSFMMRIRLTLLLSILPSAIYAFKVPFLDKNPATFILLTIRVLILVVLFIADQV